MLFAFAYADAQNYILTCNECKEVYQSTCLTCPPSSSAGVTTFEGLTVKIQGGGVVARIPAPITVHYDSQGNTTIYSRSHERMIAGSPTQITAPIARLMTSEGVSFPTFSTLKDYLKKCGVCVINEENLDNDPTNELNTDFTFNEISSEISIADAGGIKSVDVSTLMDNTDEQQLLPMSLIGTTLTANLENSVSQSISLSPLLSSMSNNPNATYTHTDGLGNQTNIGYTLGYNPASNDITLYDLGGNPANTITVQREYNTGLTLVADQLNLTDGGGTLSVDLSPYNSPDTHLFSEDKVAFETRKHDLSIYNYSLTHDNKSALQIGDNVGLFNLISDAALFYKQDGAITTQAGVGNGTAIGGAANSASMLCGNFGTGEFGSLSVAQTVVNSSVFAPNNSGSLAINPTAATPTVNLLLDNNVSNYELGFAALDDPAKQYANIFYGTTASGAIEDISRVEAANDHASMFFRYDIVADKDNELEINASGIILDNTDNGNLMSVDNAGETTLYKYPDTRDNSGTIAPQNFLYTDSGGTIQSAKMYAGNHALGNASAGWNTYTINFPTPFASPPIASATLQGNPPNHSSLTVIRVTNTNPNSVTIEIFKDSPGTVGGISINIIALPSS